MLASPLDRGVAASLERLDEDRNRGEAVGIHHLAGGARLAQAALGSVTLWNPEARRRGPSRQGAPGGLGILDAPVLHRVPRPHHVARDVAEAELRERELLDVAPRGIDGVGAHEHAAPDVGVEPVAVAGCPWAGAHGLAVEAGDAPGLAQADVVMAREGVDALGQQRGKAALGAAVDLDYPAVGQVAAHGVLVAHDLARHPSMTSSFSMSPAAST